MQKNAKAKVRAVIKETLGWVTDDRKLERAGKNDKRLAERPTDRKLKNPGLAAKTLSASLVLLVALVFSSTARAETLASAQQMFIFAQQQYGSGSPEAVMTLIHLAGANKEQGNLRRAVTLYRKSGEMAEKIIGPDDPFLLIIFNGLAATYEAMGKYADADAVYQEIRRRGHSGWADQMEFRADVMRQE